jgi:hypothetical protein
VEGSRCQSRPVGLPSSAHAPQSLPRLRYHSSGRHHIPKAVFSEAVDWWTSRVNKKLLDIFSPTNYFDGAGFYVPEAHKRWMLNLEQLLSRVGAIVRHPRDHAAQLMLIFPAMDMLGDSFTASNGIGQLMTPSRIRKRITTIEEHVPDQIRPLVMAPACRALTAAEQVAEEFLRPQPEPRRNNRIAAHSPLERQAQHSPWIQQQRRDPRRAQRAAAGRHRACTNGLPTRHPDRPTTSPGAHSPCLPSNSPR